MYAVTCLRTDIYAAHFYTPIHYWSDGKQFDIGIDELIKDGLILDTGHYLMVEVDKGDGEVSCAATFEVYRDGNQLKHRDCPVSTEASKPVRMTTWPPKQ